MKFVPLDQPASSDDPEREVAEWVLSIGGQVSVIVEGWPQGRTISSREDLPREPFKVELVGLNGNQAVTDEHLAKLKGLSKLMLLGLWGTTNITDEGLAHVAELPNLRQLFVDNTKITDEGMELLAKVKSLGLLTISETKVTDAGLEHLTTLNKLNNLRLGEHVTDSGLTTLRSFPHLETLNLVRSDVTDEGIRNCAEITYRIAIGRFLRFGNTAMHAGCIHSGMDS